MLDGCEEVVWAPGKSFVYVKEPRLAVLLICDGDFSLWILEPIFAIRIVECWVGPEVPVL